MRKPDTRSITEVYRDEIDKIDLSSVSYDSFRYSVLNAFKEGFSQVYNRLDFLPPVLTVFDMHGKEQLNFKGSESVFLTTLSNIGENMQIVESEMHLRVASILEDETFRSVIKDIDFIVLVSSVKHKQDEKKMLVIQMLDRNYMQSLVAFRIEDVDGACVLRNILGSDLYMPPPENISSFSEFENRSWTTASRSLLRDYNVDKMIHSIFD